MLAKYLSGTVILTNKVPYQLGGLDRQSPLILIVIVQFIFRDIYKFFYSVSQETYAKKNASNLKKKIVFPDFVEDIIFSYVSDNSEKKNRKFFFNIYLKQILISFSWNFLKLILIKLREKWQQNYVFPSKIF